MMESLALALRNEPEAALVLLLVVVVCLVALAAAAFHVFCWWRILSRAGYSGALSLLLLVPLGNLILLLLAAFGNWPVLEELRRLKYHRRRKGNSG